MDLLNINFKSLLPNVVDAFSYVYGEKYRAVIQEKLYKALMLHYYDLPGLEKYVMKADDIEATKVTLQFFEELGADLQKYGKIDYLKSVKKILNQDDYHIFQALIANPNYFVTYRSPLFAFSDSYAMGEFSKKKDQVNVINLFLEGEGIQITIEQLEAFYKTAKYQEILKKVQQCTELSLRFIIRYLINMDKFRYVDDFIQSENSRKKEIQNRYINQLIDYVTHLLPDNVQKMLSSKQPEEQRKLLFPDGIESPSVLEYFSQESLQKLADQNTKSGTKKFTIDHQTSYLNALGLVPKNRKFSRTILWRERLLFLHDENTKKYLPNEEVIKMIRRKRIETYDDIELEYLYSRQDYQRIQQTIMDNRVDYPEMLETDIFVPMENNKTCVLSRETFNKDNEFLSVMLFTVWGCGNLCYNFLHECTHIIEQNAGIGFGFEPDNCNLFSRFQDKQGKKYRKYERFNETISDIFTRRLIQHLHDKGIFLMEPMEFTNLDIQDNNTSAINAEILEPLFERFEDVIIDIKVTAKTELLIERIGRDNYEDLVDALNTVDDLVSRINLKSNKKLQDLYQKERIRIDEIYQRIDHYYAEHHSQVTI